MYDVASQTQASGLSFRRLAVIGRRQWWVVVGCVLLAGVGAGGYVKTKSVSYTAVAQVTVALPTYTTLPAGNSGTPTISTSALLAGSLSPIVEVQDSSVRKAAEAAGGQVALGATLSADQSTVYVTANAPNPGQAVAAANAAVGAFVTQRTADLQTAANPLGPVISGINDKISKTDAKIQALGKSANSAGLRLTVADLTLSLKNAVAQQQALNTAQGEVRAAEKATPATVAVSGKSKKAIEVAVVAGLLAGLGIALAREQFDDKIRSSAEFAEISKTEVLAELPVSDLGARAVTIADKPFGETAEAVRELRTALRFLSVKRPIRTVLVTSAGAGEGKSFVAANLAAAWAMSGVRTILVSSDMRRPSLERLFQIDTTRKGLSEAIVDAALSGHGRSMEGFSYLDESDVHRELEAIEADDVNAAVGEVDVDDLLVATSVDGLFLLPSGPSPPNPAELLGSPELGKLMVSLRERAEVVVLDSPPVMAVTDPLVLTAHVDGVLFVISENRTSRGAAQRSLRLLESGLAPVLGVVVNRSSRPQGVTHY
jgi:succinoglycan biosynthesis transport protein ExoP